MTPQNLSELVEQAKTIEPRDLFFEIGDAQGGPAQEFLDPKTSALYYRFLFLLARKLRPWIAVELGTWYGLSALALAKGNPDGQVLTIDNQDQVWTQCRAHNVRFEHADSIHYGPKPERIELLFIDTEHNGQRPQAEFEAWLPHLRHGAVVLFDDVDLNEDMRGWWKYFQPEGALKLDLPLHGNAGFGALIMNGQTGGS